MDRCKALMEFVRSEIERLSKRMSTTPRESPDFQELISELKWTLPLNDRREVIPCGWEARTRTVDVLSEKFWSSDCYDSISYDKFINRALQRFTSEFVMDGREFSENSMEQMVEDCLGTFRDEYQDTLHFIPCNLFDKLGATNLDFGELCFFNRDNFWRFVDHLAARGGASVSEMHDLEKRVIEWYQSFEWIAAVWVRNCTNEKSRQRAESMVSLGLNILALNFHHSQAGKMYSLASSRMASQAIAEFWWRSGVGFGYQYGWQATASFADGEGWYTELAADEPKSLLDAIKSLTSLYSDASVQYPIVGRLVDALNWSSSGMREVNPGYGIVKAITSLECLVMTGVGHQSRRKADSRRANRDDLKVKNTVITRSAALYGISYIDPDLERVRNVIGKGYALRSDVLHGSTSPQAPSLHRELPEVMNIVSEIILGTIVLWNRIGLINRLIDNEELHLAFEQLVKNIQSEHN